MRKLVLALACGSIAVVSSCAKHEAASSSAPPPPATSAPVAAAATAAPPPVDADDVVGLADGALIVVAPESIGPDAGAFRMIDGDKRTHYSTPEDKPVNQVSVIALPQRTLIERIAFDTADAGLDTHTPKHMLVEVSDVSPTDGFKPIADVTLATMKDDQAFPATAVPGRFVRVTIKENYGGQLTEVAEFRAYGKKLETTPMPNVTGAYETSNWRTLHLKQEGSRVSGCLGDPLTPVSGGVEGHIVKISIDTESEKGPAILIFSPDTKTLFGGYWKTNGVSTDPSMTVWDGKKVSDQPGDCPSSPEKVMAKALEDEKRLRLYGINFDSDSDHLRDESKPTLDLVNSVLKDHPDWKLTIEGHTDSTASAEHNQQLSQARANSVKAYLVAAGTDGGRLKTTGLGATKPVASNDTQLGRAANRRVELVRE